MASAYRGNLKTLALLALATICLSELTTTGTALAKNRTTPTSYVGWVWADQRGYSSCYSPPAPWSYNSQGGAISVCPIPGDPSGSYYVTFSGLSPGWALMDNAQVVAYDGNPAYGGHYCSLGYWEKSGSDVVATVFCHTPTGTLAGYSMFALFYQARSGNFGSSSNGMAYLLDDKSTQSSYTPAIQYNSTGGTNTIVRNGVGSYTATLPGLQSTYSDVQVTEIDGGLPAGHCSVGSWGSYQGGTNVQIGCYDGDWNASDRPFSVAYTVNESFGLTTPSHSEGAFAWANDSGNTSLYIPSVFYQYNGFGTGYLKAQKLSTGEYAVYLPASVRVSTSNVLVAAYGTNNICDVDEWSSSTIYVDCWNQNGAAVDSLFDVALQTAE